MDSDTDMYDYDDELGFEGDEEEEEDAMSSQLEPPQKDPTPEPAVAPPKPRLTAEEKGKLTTRKRYLADVAELQDRFGGKTGDIVRSE